ncbi:hypothetical protein [Salipiger sp. PrR002]|uniref:hypothetical protein n=1 Tax=Salipiger sp. PrR002 TaxID=2706489 RepID=UPI0013BA4C79|nr:hypothetical protein [Salipiger sp. PrR002]NDW02547.1 hypothetical protein [Salipiger sp. PrR002]NDW59687.1 hypothetical protein [Salipiger sp. PrR004]
MPHLIWTPQALAGVRRCHNFLAPKKPGRFMEGRDTSKKQKNYMFMYGFGENHIWHAPGPLTPS